MSTLKIIIPFTPKAKDSWRLGKYGKYNPSSHKMLKTREYVRKTFGDKIFNLLKGPLLVIVHFRIPLPTTWTKKKRVVQHLLPHIKRPDGDNLEKFLNDALNGLIWDDDSRIAWLLRSKSLIDAKEGETIIFIRELENSLPDYNLIISDVMEHIKIGEQNVA